MKEPIPSAAPDTPVEALIHQAAHYMRSWRRVLIAGHRNPDGDALAATLGLALALRASGCEVVAVNADPPISKATTVTPHSLQRFGLAATPGAETVVRWEYVDKRPFDGAVVVDCGALDRLHRDPEIPRRVLARCGVVIVIDHHLTSMPSSDEPELPGKHIDAVLRIVDPTRASTAELIAQVIEAADLPVDEPVATALLTGIATDTKGFLRDNSDVRTFEAAARLRAMGGSVAVARDILEGHNVGFLQLVGNVFSNATILDGGIGIVAAIPQDLLATCQVDDADLERLTTMLSGTRGTAIIVLLQEKADEIRGSVRTSSAIDSVAIARHFGGGGHARRAGFRVRQAPLRQVHDEATAVVQNAIRALTEQGDTGQAHG